MDKTNCVDEGLSCFTQASILNALLKPSDDVFGAVTKSFTPSKLKALAAEVLAITTKLYVGCVQSLLEIFTIALEVPTAVGVNNILKVLEPLAAKELAGLALTLN